MATVNHYRIWCNTESTWVYVWGTEAPTVCPNNNTHTIDTNSIAIVKFVSNEEVRSKDGKLRTQESSRPTSAAEADTNTVLKTYFAGAGDDNTDVTDVGGGVKFAIEHTVGGDNPQTVYLDLNIIENETWIHEGYLIWKDANFDSVSMEIVPTVTSCHIDSTAATYFDLYGGYIIIPAAGNGTLVIDSDITSPTGGLVYMAKDDKGNRPMSFWNADWNSSTKVYENVTPAPYGDGEYNMFAIEVVLERFINQFPLLNFGFQRLQTADTDQLGSGLRFKLTANTYGTDHDWKVAFAMTLYRARTA